MYKLVLKLEGSSNLNHNIWKFSLYCHQNKMFPTTPTPWLVSLSWEQLNLFNCPNSDGNEISLYIITTCSNMEVTRKKEIIAKDETCWYLDVFSLPASWTQSAGVTNRWQWIAVNSNGDDHWITDNDRTQINRVSVWLVWIFNSPQSQWFNCLLLTGGGYFVYSLMGVWPPNRPTFLLWFSFHESL